MGRESSQASNDGTRKVWDARTGAEILAVKGERRASGVSASLQPGRVAIVIGYLRLDCEDLDAKQRCPMSSRSMDTKATSCRRHFSPDGSRVLTGSFDKTAKVGTRRAAPNFSRSRGTSVRSFRRCSAPRLADRDGEP